ncbi:MAG TPA: alpha/beta fold hydrolase [Pyrinomonadaceae bacterium]|nr:alpha/beta fold hydrolase [Pyrinomonadaceae bacterium]
MGRGVARVRGTEVAYDDAGGGEAVVLLHGFPFDRSMWREQAQALSGTCRVVAPDLRGMGETPLGGANLTMGEMAEDVAALLDELKVERVVLGGLSMGGYVAFEFYRRFPARVRALVLADTRPQADTDEARRTREETARRALDEGVAPVADSMLPKLLSEDTRAGRPDVVERVRAMMLGTRPEGAAAALRAMAVRRDQTDLLASVDVPTLIIVGGEDPITPPSDSEAMGAKIRGARLVRIEGASHLSNVERLEEFNRALGDFVNGLSS